MLSERADHIPCDWVGVDYFLVGVNTVMQLKKLLAIRFEGVWPNSLTAPLISRLPEKLIDPRTWGEGER